MSTEELTNEEIPKHYDPAATEQKWSNFWEENQFFHSEPDDREPFTVVIPPPNVTGVLHMGHMLNNTIQDVLVRRARMQGKNTCWVPGTDHASIATEAKVVQKLRKKGIKKSDLSRDKFMEHAWEWTDQHGGIILQQLKTIGASCDWKRTRFTLEEELYEAVISCFIQLYEDGYIYRGKRMINWDPAAQTALSDEEVIHKEVQSKLYHVRYKIKDSDQYVTIATTRPETILADTAVCVNPDDERYKGLIGKTAIIPMVNREVEIIADEYVDPEFGTGCLKITPAHDPNDYDLGIKHGLEIIDMLNADGTLSDAAEHYVGKDRFEARKLIIKDLEKQELLVKTEDMPNKVGYSERTDVVIEPRLSLQWFCKMEELSKPALDNVLNDEVQFHPAKFKNSYQHWMENIRDWCISRQLWWGHRIPAWYFGDGENEYVIARTEDEALEKAQEKSGKTLTADQLSQDEDVLDTWFSSWLWPISVFDGINKPDNREVNYYYPTQDLVTAPEIMFFWVARMIMAGYYFRDEKPFSNVYFHGIVRDEKRQKMSKSLGNSPDPLKLIEKYGADGTRVGMLFASPAGNDLLFDEALCEQGRNFSNKIWNAFRFLSMNKEAGTEYTPTLELDSDNLADRWMKSRILSTMKEVENDFEAYRLNEALKKLYSLVWDDFCDWYIEVSKSDVPGENMPKENLERALGLFELLMKLLHPFMPFITEEIWQRIQNRSTYEALTISEWPDIEGEADSEAIELFRQIQEQISAIRNIQAEMGLSPKAELEIKIKPAGSELAQQLETESWIYHKFLTISDIQFDTSIDKPKASASALVRGTELFIPLEGLIDLDKEKERIRKEIAKMEGFLKSVNGKLSNEKFVENAPDAVVEKERQKKADAESDIKILNESLENLEA
ncbi:valine--tRNA ligase [Rhodohalobacter sp. SW132]|uniref:valine--tRNA ligase n=1 Tax=Rhodohalobacter sp. SW132 TaxID=2293433 RepID=UPI000E2401CC|nr:valine--tRNA ligase [Rhodohalobacter sp. SW132]REL37847.1 valine--tRNA ligase [Rhodohalobacter sp. SW132]